MWWGFLVRPTWNKRKNSEHGASWGLAMELWCLVHRETALALFSRASHPEQTTPRLGPTSTPPKHPLHWPTEPPLVVLCYLFSVLFSMDNPVISSCHPSGYHNWVRFLRFIVSSSWGGLAEESILHISPEWSPSITLEIKWHTT
jgi:hypothetical protein